MIVQSTHTNSKNSWLSASLYYEIKQRVTRSFHNADSDIEDAFHEALLAVLKSFDASQQPEVPNNVEAYLVTATKSRLIDACRRRTSANRKHDGFAADCAVTLDYKSDDPESLAMSVQRSAYFQLFFDCLRGNLTADIDPTVLQVFNEVHGELAQRLSDEHWAVLRARGLHGSSFEICATLIQSSLGTAHNRWQEAISLIRDVFIRHGVNLEDGIG